MARLQVSTTNTEKPKVTRKGVHAKTKQSKSKGATNYKKGYRGQGR